MKNGLRSLNLHLLVRQFANPIMIILIVATFISMFIGDVISGLIIFAIIFPSGLLGYFQEHRAGRIMEELLKQIRIEVEVIRNGVEITIPESEVVIGEVIVLRVGDVIPADCLIEESEGLLVDESVLTGESFPKEKIVGEPKPGKEIPGRDTEIFQGTHVVGGRGRARALRIGLDTEFGAITREISNRDVTTGFEKGTLAFGLLILRAMLVLVVGLFAMNMLLHRPVIESLLFSLALAVGLTPQLLPVIISVSLSAGAREMAAKNVLVKRLDAIEDLGLMNVFCTDKTGTLTSGLVILKQCLQYDGIESSEIAHLALINSTLQSGFINPIDQAIIDSAGSMSITEKKLDELAYDFERRRLSVLTNEFKLITKGALGSIIDISTNVRIGNEITSIDLAHSQIMNQFERLSNDGKRVLGIASKQLSKNTLESSDEMGMVFEGLLVFEDAPKAGAAQAVAAMKGLGIQVHLITGDNALVAKSISAQVGIDARVVLTGREITNLSDEALKIQVKQSFIYAEINPIQKERIVKALRSNGDTVGFFGDGINDCAALHAADIGITVDTAVDGAKSAASIVLLKRDLTVLAEGILLGRKTFVNTLKYIRVGVSAAFGNVFSMAIAAIFLPFLPLLPMQILLLNFLTDFPAITISGDEVDQESLTRPQAWEIKSIRKFMILFGFLSSCFDILTFLVLRLGFNADETLFRSGWFVESTLTELSVMMVLRTNRKFWQSKPGKGLFWSSAVLTVISLGITYSPINSAIGLSPLPFTLLLSLIALIMIYIYLNEFVKKYWLK